MTTRADPPMYRVDLSLEMVEQLEQGLCSEALAQLAHDLLHWRREAIRATTTPRTYPNPKGPAHGHAQRRRPRSQRRARR
jgi:hypothetical protein